MGAVGGLLGVNGGTQGTGISGPQGAPIEVAVGSRQSDAAYKSSENALQQQHDLVKALQGQNAIQKQTAQYNQAQALSNALAGANGVGNQSQALAAQQQLAQQQQATAGQYQDIAAGRGPNPAAAMLNQATGQNVANQAAMMAGQRGAASNVGMMARQAGQLGANTQQQAVGQGAVMQANQQIAGLQGLSGQQQAIGATNQNVAGIAAQQLAAQQAQQQALAGQAAGMMGNLQGANTAYNQAAQGQQAAMLGQITAQNNANVASTGNVNSANAGLAGKTIEGQQAMIGGMMGGAGGGAAGLGTPSPPPGAAAAGAQGGAVENGTVMHLADGGMSSGFASSYGQVLNNIGQAGADSFSGMGGDNSGSKSLNKGMGQFASGIRTAAMAPSPVVPMTGGDGGMKSMAQAPAFADGGLAAGGGKVEAESPDQKAVKPGNSYANDKVPAMLSEGEIVIPRDVLQSPDPIRAAADFVAQTLSKRNSKAQGGMIYAADGADLAQQEQPAMQVAEAQPQAIPVAPKTPAQEAQDANNEDLLLQQDFAAGKIHPQTYGDLFAKRDTLGKVGTLFGLIVAGAGAGLTHSPNVVMDMMNKEIERDLEAQKQSNTNAQNWYNAAKAHELQKHQQQEIDARSQGNRVENVGKALESDITRERLKQTAPGADLSASNAMRDQLIATTADAKAANGMRIGLGQTFQNHINQMPPGPAKATAQNVLNSQILPAIGAKNAETNQKATAKKQAIQALSASAANPSGEAKEPWDIGDAPSPVNDKVFNTGKMRGETNLPGFGHGAGNIDPGVAGKITAELPAVKGNREAAYQWYKAFHQLYNAPNAGQAPGMSEAGGLLGAGVGALSALIPGVGPLVASGVGGATAGAGALLGKLGQKTFETERTRLKDMMIAQLKNSNITKDEAESMAESMLPKWNDDTKSAERAFKLGLQHFKDQEKVLGSTLTTEGAKTPGLYQPMPDLKFIPRKEKQKKEKSKIEKDMMKIGAGLGYGSAED